MLVVSDSTPLHYLILIGEIDVLRELYGRVVIPAAVIDELSAPNTPLQVRQWIAAMPEWATVTHLAFPISLPFPSLGQGEREAIAMARSSSNSILLTDDLRARVAAESLGIQVVPTIRILSTASALLLLDFESALSRLQQTNFRVSREIIDQLVKQQSLESSE